MRFRACCSHGCPSFRDWSRGLCNMHRLRMKSHGCLEHSRQADVSLGHYSEPFVKRFNNKLLRNHHGCLEWSGHRNNDGYGTVRINKRTYLAHRISFSISNGPIPNGMNVLHKCDNPACVNVEHLFLGTHADNMADMAEKKRGKTGMPKGSKNPRRRLSDEVVISILNDNRSQQAIADSIGVSQALISLIKLRKRYAHVLFGSSGSEEQGD